MNVSSHDRSGNKVNVIKFYDFHLNFDHPKNYIVKQRTFLSKLKVLATLKAPKNSCKILKRLDKQDWLEAY